MAGSADGSEPVNITINDNVSPSVAVKIKAIADAARDADAAVVRLRAQLSDLDAATIRALTDATTKNTKAYLDQEAALNRAVAAEAKAQKATIDLAVAQEKLAAAEQATGAASMKAEAALNSAVLTEQKVTAAALEAEAALLKQAEANAAVAASQGAVNVDPRRPGVSSAEGSASVFLKQELADRLAVTDATTKQTAAGEKLLNNLNMQSLTAGKTASEIAEIKAAQLGVSEQAAPFIANLKKAEAELHGFSLAATGTQRELGVMGREIASGNWTRFGASFSRFLSLSGAMEAIMSPLGLSIVAVGGALTTVAIAALKGEEEFTKLNGIIKATGDYAGITAGSYKQMQHDIADSTGQGLGPANAALMTLVSSGKIGSDTLKLLATDSVNLAHMTGESADKVAADFIKMTDGVTKYAIEFNSKYHMLDAAQIDYIRQLENMGQKEEAERQLSQDVYTAIANKGVEQLGILERAVKSTEDGFSHFWEYLKSIGRDATLQEQIAKLSDTLKDVEANNHGKNRDNVIATLQNELDWRKKLLDNENASAQMKANEAKVEQEGIEASSRLSEGKWAKFKKDTNAADEAVKQFRADLAQALAVNPHDTAALQDKANQAAVEARIRKAFDPVGTADANKAQRQAESRAVTMDALNTKLKDQLNVLTQVGNKSKEQTDWDTIQVDMIKRKITLTDAETASIKANLSAQANTRRSNDLDTEIKQIQSNTANLKLNSDERRIQEQLDRAQAAEIAKGNGPFSPQQIERMRQAFQLQQQINEIAAVKDAPRNAAKGATDSIAEQVLAQHQYENNEAEMYARIQAMQQAGVLSAQQAAQATMQYELLVQQERLANYQTFFGTLAQLQNSSNSTLAGIGKAAAIAQATIDAYLAINKALATLPFPLNYAEAGAIGLVAFANVANIAGVKFADGGYVSGPGGSRADRINASLSNGEFVVNARATAANRKILQAINDNKVSIPHYADGGYVQTPQGYIGGSVNNTYNNSSGAKLVIENHGTPQTYTRVPGHSLDEMRYVARDILHTEGPDMMAGQVSDPNSKFSRANGRHTTAQRKRNGVG